MDGRATLRELAWRNGLALFAMMDWAARLVQDGVCAITSPEYAVARQQNAGVSWTQPDLSLLGRILTRLRQLDLAWPASSGLLPVLSAAAPAGTRTTAGRTGG
jgi:hypothetical protein